MKDARIVAHFIAGFPTVRDSLECARGLIEGGAYALEMQIPFSDPTADGPVIESACRKALEGGFAVRDAWTILETLRSESDIPIFVMSYANPAVAAGMAPFVRRAADAGAGGLIIPDLCPPSDEGLYAEAAAAGCPAVPVLVPWMSHRRLEEILSVGPQWLYVALRSGITGAYTALGSEQTNFLNGLKGRGIRVMAGFGIQKHEQVNMIMSLADAAVVGSVLVRAIAEAENPRRAVKGLLLRLRGIA